MIKQLEIQIRDLKRELAQIQKGKAVLRFQPCHGDSEISEKEAKFGELDRRAKVINETIRDLKRRRQLLVAQSITKGSYESPNSSDSS